MWQYVAVCCSVLQCVAVCYSAVQSVIMCCTVCCSVLQCVTHSFILRCTVCCSVLQCVAVCCSVSQSLAHLLCACVGPPHHDSMWLICVTHDSSISVTRDSFISVTRFIRICVYPRIWVRLDSSISAHAGCCSELQCVAVCCKCTNMCLSTNLCKSWLVNIGNMVYDYASISWIHKKMHSSAKFIRKCIHQLNSKNKISYCSVLLCAVVWCNVWIRQMPITQCHHPLPVYWGFHIDWTDLEGLRYLHRKFASNTHTCALAVALRPAVSSCCSVLQHTRTFTIFLQELAHMLQQTTSHCNIHTCFCSLVAASRTDVAAH